MRYFSVQDVIKMFDVETFRWNVKLE